MTTPALATVGDFIATRGHTATLERAEPLFFEGDRSLSVYACVAGRIRVFVTLPSGRDLVLGMKQPTEAFGELSAIDGRPRSASAVAAEPSVVAHMDGRRFLDELNQAPELAVAVLRGLADQLRRANARLRARNGESTFARTGHMLVEMCSLKMRHDPRPGAIELDITQDDLADWIGATRESTARALGRYRSAGVLRTSRGRIAIDDLHGVVALIESE
jgi:CRP-like cAMP-binding protein